MVDRLLDLFIGELDLVDQRPRRVEALLLVGRGKDGGAMRCHDYVRGMVGCRAWPLRILGALVYGWLGMVFFGGFDY